MNYQGLRAWLETIDGRGELQTLENVDWKLEMGAIVDVLYREHPPYPPALIFDKIKDHRSGYRALFGHFASPQRIALTLGVDDGFDHVLEFTRTYHEKIKHCVPIPMTEVTSGPIHKNVQDGEQVNLFDFPAPLLHEKDGGRYIGTGHLVITKDPDSNWINVGTYRIMLQDRNSASTALSTRCDPESDIDIQCRSWSSSLDPMIHPDSKALMNSRAVIDACRPYEWMNQFPDVAETSPELRKQVLGKLGRAFFGLR